MQFLKTFWAAYIIGCRENGLSPVIQATWEARTEGWLEVKWLPPPGEWILWPH